MKKLILTIILVLAVVSMSFALPFYNANQVALAWNAVATDIDGDTITGVTYKLYLANANTDPNKTNPVIVAETSDIQITITLSKGKYYVGVQAWLDDLSSPINWGDEVENQENVEIFGLRFAVPPHPSKDLRR